MNFLFRITGTLLLIPVILAWQFCVKHYDGLLSQQCIAALAGILTISYFAMNNKGFLTESMVVKFIMLVLSAVAVALGVGHPVAVLGLLTLVTGIALVLIFDEYLMMWWDRFCNNRRIRKERRRSAKQARKNRQEGLSIFDEPQPVA